MTHLTMNRHHSAWPHDVIRVQQLSGCGMAGNVDQSVALMYHGGAKLRQAINHSIDGILITRDERGCQQNGISLPHLDVSVLSVGDPARAESGSPWDPVEMMTTSLSR